MDTSVKGPRSQALRRGRWSESGRIYLLTTTTVNRESRFAQTEAAYAVVRAFYNAPFWEDSELLAWVLMPDHWHGLVRIGDRQDLAKTMGRFKAITSLRCNQLQNRTGVLWQPGYHDHALRQDEDVVSAARYVVMNPVRAGLATGVGDYPFWDAVWL